MNDTSGYNAIFEYSINGGGWTQVTPSFNGTHYYYVIDGSNVVWGDNGILSLAARVIATDNDNDVVVDVPYADSLTTDMTSVWLFTITDPYPPTIQSVTGPTGAVCYASSNEVWLVAYEPIAASLVSEAYLNYSVNGGTWTVSCMGLQNTTIVGQNVKAAFIAHLPLVYGYHIDYYVVCYDHAGNKAKSSTYSVTQVTDTVAPVFMYSRVVGAQPNLNGTLAVRFYEPADASGMSYVQVHIGIKGQTLTAHNMTYNAETDTWLFTLAKIGPSDVLEYYLTGVDRAGNSYTTAHVYYVMSVETPVATSTAEGMNVIETANTVGNFRSIFSVQTEGVYGFMPVLSTGIANFTMWLDGQFIEAGAQVILNTGVHILMIRVETGDTSAVWGVQVMNMKSQARHMTVHCHSMSSLLHQTSMSRASWIHGPWVSRHLPTTMGGTSTTT